MVFFDFHYSEKTGKIYLEVDKLDMEFLYVHSLSTGLGSNDLGLDRGQLGEGVLVKFVKSGKQDFTYSAKCELPGEYRKFG